ncbi:hypothetical protein [Sphingomonas morindae]|uniref:Uncharacterized protein n=1 Tax=Sphingomonas morindae TaxID=1541170 RepID=A0ABY4X551_9SPHN|nr:hypothetical protein [Sphingomonas morindae]USI72021.1 hypothetical protein LHA26_11960 [Sphingomonas morindae]
MSLAELMALTPRELQAQIDEALDASDTDYLLLLLNECQRRGGSVEILI